MLKEVYEIIYLAGVKSIFRRLAKPAPAGKNMEMEDFYDIFDLYHSDIGPRKLITIVDQIIKVYKDNQIQAFFRTCNPFFWLGLLGEYLVNKKKHK